MCSASEKEPRTKKTKGNQENNVRTCREFSKEIEIIKINQVEVLDLKSTITEMKNSLEGFSGRSEQSEERICELRQLTLFCLRSRKEKE